MLRDRAAYKSNLSGTGNVTVDGTFDGMRSLLDAGYEYGDTVPLCVVEADLSNYERMEGIFTAGSPDFVTRGTFLESLTGEPVTFSNLDGKLVFVDAGASMLASGRGRLNIGTTSGTVAAYTISLPVPVEQLKDGVEFWGKIHADNTSADVTIAPDEKDAKPIKHGMPRRKPAIGALKQDGWVLFKFDQTNDCWAAIQGLVKTTKVVADAVYAVLEEDYLQTLVFTNASAAVTIAQSTAQFGAPFEFDYVTTGGATFTPTTSTVNTAASLATTANQSGRLWADGGNYRATQLGAGAAIALAGSAVAVSGANNGAAPNTQFDMTFTDLVLKDAAGTARQVSAKATVDITLAGISGLDTGAEANSTFYAIWAVDRTAPIVNAAVTADPATDKITHAAHGMSANQPVVPGGTAVPTGLTAGTTYYIRDVNTNDYKLAATPNGAAINFTSAGTAVTISTVAALILSTSATAPTLPAGFTFKALIGTVLNNSSGNLTATVVNGKSISFADQAVLNNAAVTTVGTFQTLSLAAFVPAWAKKVSGNMGRSDIHNTPDHTIMVASSTAGEGAQFWGAWNSYNASALFGFLGGGSFLDLAMKAPQTIAWTAGGDNAYFRITINGFTI